VPSCVGRACSKAARTYRTWKTQLPALRVVEDANVIGTLRSLKVRDGKRRPRPEILYGRWKMTAWLRRNGIPEASKHTVDRLKHGERMKGLVRGRGTRTSIPGNDGKRAGDLLNRDFRAGAPNRVWATDSTYDPVYSGFVYVALVIDLYSRAIVTKSSPYRSGALKTESDLIEVVFEWVHWYNSDRLHSSLEHRTPEEYEKTYYDENSGSLPDAAAHIAAA
jgi:transposase InsO family protein